MGKFKEISARIKREGKLVYVGKTSDIPPGRGATVRLRNGSEIALLNSGNGFYAVENFCPHKGYPLVDSKIDKAALRCPFHDWKFSVQNGECLTKKNCGVEVFEVIIEDGLIKLRV